MPLFLARWPDGSCSIVKARTRDEAIILLDEFGNADCAEIFVLKNFMMDFTLSPDGDCLMVNEMGDETLDEVFKKAYPLLHSVQRSDAEGPAYPTLLDEAMAAEKTRVKPDFGPLGETQEAIDLQRDFDMPSVKADEIVRQVDKELKRKRRKRDAN